MDTWDYYGRRDPYFGVLSTPEYRIGKVNADARERFFQSGVTDVDRLIGFVTERFGSPNFAGVALDYGCGVGRLSGPLSARFSRVISVDISDSMLARAREQLAERPVAFERADAMTQEPVDFVLSYIVFQHIPTAAGLEILAALAKRVRGSGVIHIPVRYTGGVIRGVLGYCRRIVQRITPFIEPVIPMYVYPLEEFRGVLHRAGFTTDVVFEDVGTRHSFANVVFKRNEP